MHYKINRAKKAGLSPEDSQGMGLGMSISYGIIERHKGKILVESEPGLGTIIIQIPADFEAWESRNSLLSAINPVSVELI